MFGCDKMVMVVMFFGLWIGIVQECFFNGIIGDYVKQVMCVIGVYSNVICFYLVDFFQQYCNVVDIGFVFDDFDIGVGFVYVDKVFIIFKVDFQLDWFFFKLCCYVN